MSGKRRIGRGLWEGVKREFAISRSGGNACLSMLRQPVMVMTADRAELASIRAKAMGRGISTAIYTEELFSAGHDAASRAAVAGVPAEDLNLVGVALSGAKNGVDRVVKRARMHG